MRIWGKHILFALVVLAPLLLIACGGARGPDAARGEKLYNTRCWNCHEKDTEAMSPVPGQGSGLKGFSRRSPHQDANGEQHEHTDEFIRSIILNGTMNMPPQNENMPERDLADLIAYVKTL